MMLRDRKISPVVRDNTVQFYYPAGPGRVLDVIGSFNNWGRPPLPLRPLAPGPAGVDHGLLATETITLATPGRYQYLFRIDGREIPDEINFNRAFNPAGPGIAPSGPVSFFDTWIDPRGMKEQIAGIREELAQNPVQGGNPWIRSVVISIFDQYIMIPSINRSVTVMKLYLDCLERCLRVLATKKITSGILIAHIYNMGFIIKAPDITIGIDVISTRESWNLNYDVPDRLIDALAAELDVLLVTHQHSDHADPDLMARMLRHPALPGRHAKTVYVPMGNRMPIPPGCRFLSGDGKISAGANTIEYFSGRHVYDQGRNLNHISYLLTTAAGQTVYHTGDLDYTASHSGLGGPGSGGLGPGGPLSGQVDIALPKYGGISPYHEDDYESLKIFLSRVKPKLLIPAHLGELSHYPGGGRESYRQCLEDINRLSTDSRIMLWGEMYHYD